MTVNHDIQAILTGVPVRDIVEAKKEEKIWKKKKKKKIWKKRRIQASKAMIRKADQAELESVVERVAKKTGLPEKALHHYIVVKGMSIDDAIATISKSWKDKVYKRAAKIRGERDYDTDQSKYSSGENIRRGRSHVGIGLGGLPAGGGKQIIRSQASVPEPESDLGSALKTADKLRLAHKVGLHVNKKLKPGYYVAVNNEGGHGSTRAFKAKHFKQLGSAVAHARKLGKKTSRTVYVFNEKRRILAQLKQGTDEHRN